MNTELYCVGTEKQYIDMLRLAREGGAKLNAERLRYIGESCPKEIPPESGVLLLRVKPEDIAVCVRRGLETSFLYQDHVLCKEDDVYIGQLEEMCIRQCDYRMLKELNIIRMAFCVMRGDEEMTSEPVHIQLEHTTYCNARCIMCDHFIAHNRGSRHLRFEALTMLDRQLMAADEIIMHGNGEPLLHPQILDFFERYHRYGVKVSLNTNLSCLDSEIVQALRRDCRSIHVSCDGTTKEEYEQIRRGLSYHTFIAHLDELSRNTDGVEKVMEVVLMNQNLRSAAAFVEMAHRYGFSRVIFNALGVNRFIGNEADALERCKSYAREQCARAQQEGERLNVKVVTPYDGCKASDTGTAVYAPHGYPDAEASRRLHLRYPEYTNQIALRAVDNSQLVCGCGTFFEGGVCEYPFAKTYIDLDGNVSFCCPASRRIVGKISEEAGFGMIWNGEKYRQIRRTFFRRQLPSLCNDCYLMNNASLYFLRKEGEY